MLLCILPLSWDIQATHKIEMLHKAYTGMVVKAAQRDSGNNSLRTSIRKATHKVHNTSLIG